MRLGREATNPLADALLGDTSGLPPRERNIAWRHFTRAASRVVRARPRRTRGWTARSSRI
jgi:hypothetical protein